MIELYLDSETEGDRNYCIVLNIDSNDQINRDIGNLIIGSVKSGSLTDSVAAGKLFVALMESIFRRKQTSNAGDIFSSGNTRVVSRKNFVAGVDNDGFYTHRDPQTNTHKIRKLEINDITVDNDPDDPPF